MPKVSVVIPVYNVEKYVERCARSLFEQTLDDIEYIFINDCSPDNSMNILVKIIEDYPKRKFQIRILKMPTNSGLAAVRRQGIKLATGDFIIHCDGDDWVDVDLYERMYTKAIQSRADIVVCDLKDVYQTHSVKRYNPEFCFNAKETIKRLYRNSFHLSTANKLVRRSIFVDNKLLPYEGINMWEDNGLMYRVFYCAKGLAQVRDSYYNYNRCNEGSITSGYGRKAVEQMIECASLLTEFFESKPDADDFVNSVQFIQYLAKINLITSDFSGIREFKSLFPKTKHPPRGFDKNAFSAKGRFRFCMVKYHLSWLFVLMFKIKIFFANEINGCHTRL